MFVHVGIKRKLVEIPDGYEQIHSGKIQKGDMFCNLILFKWELVDNNDIGLKIENFIVDGSGAIIRKIERK